MKKYIFIVLLIAVSGVLGSCSEQMDLPDDGRIAYQDIWKDRNRTMGYLNKCYAFRQGPDIMQSALTDDAQSVDDVDAGGTYQKWYQGIFDSRDWPNAWMISPNNWTNWYQGIRYCNVFIAELPNATAYGQPDEKAGWLAQAKTLRAYYYLLLIKNYGSCPLITEAYDVEHDFSRDTKAPVWKIVDQIMKDTQEALEAPGNELDAKLGFLWTIGTENANIMHRALAYAIRSQAALLIASPLFADEAENPYDWSRAAQICGEALKMCLDHDYKLQINPAQKKGYAYNAYDYYFLTNYDFARTQDKETIYLTAGVSAWNNFGMPSTQKQSSAGMSPTQELVDCYESVETDASGKILASYPVLDPDKPYNDDQHLSPNYYSKNTVYNPAEPYANRDPRLYGSIYFHGATRHWDDPEEKVEIYTDLDGKASTDGISATSKKNTRTGYYMRKYNYHGSNADVADEGSLRMFRLAELYLNYAEAANEAIGPNSAIPGSSLTMTALDAVNTIRARAGMPAVSSDESSTPDAFRNKIRNERRVEFAFEPLRFYDVRRWKILDKTDRVVTGMQITKNGEDNYSYERFVVSTRGTYDSKYFLCPIPSSEVDVMYKLTGVDWQNPGYTGAL